MDTIGVAIIVVAVMYFIDKHNLWRRLAIGLGVIVALALLGWAGLWGWTAYRDARDKKVLAEFNKKWAAEIPACNARNIKSYFAPSKAGDIDLSAGMVMPQSTMEQIKKGCSADPYKYLWNSYTSGEVEVLGEVCLDGTNDPCMLMPDGHGNLVLIPKAKDVKKASK
jgi:hypothetical protein